MVGEGGDWVWAECKGEQGMFPRRFLEERKAFEQAAWPLPLLRRRFLKLSLPTESVETFEAQGGARRPGVRLRLRTSSHPTGDALGLVGCRPKEPGWHCGIAVVTVVSLACWYSGCLAMKSR